MKFPEKLWNIVNECITGAIGWGMDGDRIFIDFEKLEMEYLGKDPGFKTKNVVSFIRQLNLYGFRKCSRHKDVHEFRHSCFIRGRKDLLMAVKRRVKCASANAGEFQMSMEQKERNDDVSEEPQNDPISCFPTPMSVYNVFWNQMCYNHLIYNEWMRRNAQLLKNETNPHSTSNATMRLTSLEDSNHSSHSMESVENSSNSDTNMNYNNVICVPIPTSSLTWPTAALDGTMALPINAMSDAPIYGVTGNKDVGNSKSRRQNENA